METGLLESWNYKSYPFRFQFGDRTLYSVTVNLMTRGFGINESVTAHATPSAPTEPLPANCDGFLIRSLQVSSELPAISRESGYVRYIPSLYPRYFIDMAQPFSEYTGKFSSKTRSTINRKLKKFAEHSGGELIWKSYKSVDEVREFHKLARSLSSRTYQEALLDAGLPDSEEFLQGMTSKASAGSVRAYLLFHAGKPVAYLYCPVDQGVLLYEYLGYDPEYRDWSVGTILQWLALENLFSEGTFTHFDFTEGESEHKRLFSTHSIQCANVFFLRDTLRNNLLARAQYLTNRFSTLLGNILEHYGLKARIKRLIRFGYRGKQLAQ